MLPAKRRREMLRQQVSQQQPTVLPGLAAQAESVRGQPLDEFETIAPSSKRFNKPAVLNPEQRLAFPFHKLDIDR